MANHQMQHQRLFDDLEARTEAEVDIEVEKSISAGDPDPMAEQRMVETRLPQPEYVEERTFCWGLCCWQGCVLGVVVMLFMFVVLPTGVLLVFHGVNKRNSFTLNIGVGVLCIPTFIALVSVVICKYCHVTRKDRRAEKLIKKRTLAFENPLSRRRGDEDVSNSFC